MVLQIEIVALSLIISAILIILGFIFKKKAMLLVLTGGIILVITGIAMLAQPISFPTGSNTTVSNNNTQFDTQIIYTTQDGFVTDVVSGAIMVLGFFFLVTSTMNLSNQKFEPEERDEEDLNFKEL